MCGGYCIWSNTAYLYVFIGVQPQPVVYSTDCSIFLRVTVQESTVCVPQLVFLPELLRHFPWLRQCACVCLVFILVSGSSK